MHDLVEAMKNTRIPESVRICLCTLLDMKRSDFLNNDSGNTHPDHNNTYSSESDETENEDPKLQIKCPRKLLKANSLFQTMFFIVNNGQKRPPFR